ncbi:MAG: hypothetical protein A2Y77_18535 [Planctomycetes bacterium RBG_13_62_9]|nr:MAG: hypothetical protein A2Y77_18535 [Planctomycetes bacterium RBG_13_62_9]
MNRNMRLYIIAVAIILCIVVLCLSTSIGQDRKKYEVEAQVYSIPPYQSDAARAIAAYERLMERHMDQTERTLAGLAADVKTLTTRLDAIDAGLTKLDTRLARIEKHLGIVPVVPSAPAPDPNAPPVPVPQSDLTK